jgi:hypothetical protein
MTSIAKFFKKKNYKIILLIKKTLKNKTIKKGQSFVLKRLGLHTWPNKKSLVRVGFARLEP